MQSGDRVLASLNLKEPDRALMDFGGTNFTGIQVTAYDGPKTLLGVAFYSLIYSYYHRRCGYGEEGERQGFIGASKGLFNESQNCRGLETGSSFCNAIGIWLIDGTNCSCYLAYQLVGLSVAHRFIREGGIPRKEKPLRGGRRRANMNVEEEEAFLAPFFGKAKEGGILVVSEIKSALDQRLGRNVALAPPTFTAPARLAKACSG